MKNSYKRREQLCKLHGPVAQGVDNAIHRINHYPLDSIVCFVSTYHRSYQVEISELHVYTASLIDREDNPALQKFDFYTSITFPNSICNDRVRAKRCSIAVQAIFSLIFFCNVCPRFLNSRIIPFGAHAY